MTEDKTALHREWLEEIKTKGKNLTTWEDEFVDSINTRLDLNQALTEKQADILERIYAEKTPS